MTLPLPMFAARMCNCIAIPVPRTGDHRYNSHIRLFGNFMLSLSCHAVVAQDSRIKTNIECKEGRYVCEDGLRGMGRTGS